MPQIVLRYFIVTGHSLVQRCDRSPIASTDNNKKKEFARRYQKMHLEITKVSGTCQLGKKMDHLESRLKSSLEVRTTSYKEAQARGGRNTIKRETKEGTKSGRGQKT